MERLLCVLGLLSAEPQAEITLFKLSRKAIEKQTSISSWCLCFGFGCASTGQLWVKKTPFFVAFLFPNGKKKFLCLKPAMGRKHVGTQLPFLGFLSLGNGFSRYVPLSFPNKFPSRQQLFSILYPMGST